jgi:hypothetical protein
VNPSADHVCNPLIARVCTTLHENKIFFLQLFVSLVSLRASFPPIRRETIAPQGCGGDGAADKVCLGEAGGLELRVGCTI